jgi:hypothetical protein
VLNNAVQTDYRHPCPSCGHCPSCGRGGWGTYPWRVYPYQYPYTVPYTMPRTYAYNGNPKAGIGGVTSGYMTTTEAR